MTRLHFRDGGTDLADDECGSYMDLGSPTEGAYREKYLEVLDQLSIWLKSRADRYRALAYIKAGGANLFTDENRLPSRCKDNVTDADGHVCFCNSKTWATNGYTPLGLYFFYLLQFDQLIESFPRKAVAYQLIQGGFPKVNYYGEWVTATGVSSGSHDLPENTEQVNTVLGLGREYFALTNPLQWVVQHNGLDPIPDPAELICDTPSDPTWTADSACPNKWVVLEGELGVLTGFQTANESTVASSEDLSGALLNAFNNSDAHVIELYEERVWEQAHNGGLTLGGLSFGLGWWDGLFKSRRPPRLPSLPT
ncbi:MAG: hypothetical protein ACKV2T_08145 [Kofleriaceae bacterium]